LSSEQALLNGGLRCFAVGINVVNRFDKRRFNAAYRLSLRRFNGVNWKINTIVCIRIYKKEDVRQANLP